jgi:hypothetical protein
MAGIFAGAKRLALLIPASNRPPSSPEGANGIELQAVKRYAKKMVALRNMLPTPALTTPHNRKSLEALHF